MGRITFYPRLQKPYKDWRSDGMGMGMVFQGFAELLTLPPIPTNKVAEQAPASHVHTAKSIPTRMTTNFTFTAKVSDGFTLFLMIQILAPRDAGEKRANVLAVPQRDRSHNRTDGVGSRHRVSRMYDTKPARRLPNVVACLLQRRRGPQFANVTKLHLPPTCEESNSEQKVSAREKGGATAGLLRGGLIAKDGASSPR